MSVTAEKCPSCGMGIFAGERYCEACGHQLAAAEPDATTAEPDVAGQRSGVPEETAGSGCTACGGPVDDDGYCDECGLLQPGERDHKEVEIAGAAGVSDIGKRYARNEDDLALATPAGARPGVVAVVCDGVSSSPNAQLASAAAAEVGAAALVQHADSDDSEATMRAAMQAAKQAVAALAESATHAPATTFVGALVYERSVTVGWIGDSRAYWVRAPEVADVGMASALLTEDDSPPGSSILTAWLGADAGDVESHVVTIEPGAAGAILLCSDGLSRYLPTADEVLAVAAGLASEPLDGARALVRAALDQGGHDNITAVIVPFPPPDSGSRDGTDRIGGPDPMPTPTATSSKETTT